MSLMGQLEHMAMPHQSGATSLSAMNEDCLQAAAVNFTNAVPQAKAIRTCWGRACSNNGNQKCRDDSQPADCLST